RTENGQTTRYYVDGDQVIAEATMTGGVATLKARYIRGQGLIAREDDMGKAYYVQNGHGDVVNLMDSTGKTKLNNYNYDIFGNISAQTETIEQSFKYSGEMQDAATGLQYLRARWYDPSIGRFTGEDTVEGQIKNPLSLNLYTYVENNPIIRFDPSGNSWIGDQWNAFVVEMKARNSSWESAMSYWTLGFSDPFFTSASVPMNSKEYWYAQADVIFNTATLGVGTFEKQALK
ncbi:RHS repeat-associated core domain-containing protein, partial [Paenibacillus sepulcri]|nr:RHS repeat-associated core domain-containing protein [Paenibacillus sepulcri]